MRRAMVDSASIDRPCGTVLVLAVVGRSDVRRWIASRIAASGSSMRRSPNVTASTSRRALPSAWNLPIGLRAFGDRDRQSSTRGRGAGARRSAEVRTMGHWFRDDRSSGCATRPSPHCSNEAQACRHGPSASSSQVGQLREGLRDHLEGPSVDTFGPPSAARSPGPVLDADDPSPLPMKPCDLVGLLDHWRADNIGGDLDDLRAGRWGANSISRRNAPAFAQGPADDRLGPLIRAASPPMRLWCCRTFSPCFEGIEGRGR